MSSYRIISSDNHVFEPPDLWINRVDATYRDRAPRLVHEQTGDWFYCDGMRVASLGGGTQPGRRFEDPSNVSAEDVWENMLPGAYMPDEQVKDMDVDGVEMNVLYPTIGLWLYRLPDSELMNILFRAYNEWIAEFCGGYPDRLKGVGMLNVDDVNIALAELERCAKMGLVGAMIPVEPPGGRPYDSSEYAPLWSAAEDLGMPLSLHVASNRTGPTSDATKPSQVCNSDLWVRMALADLIYGGVFERHPGLLVGSVEHELSWALFFLDRLDYVYTQKAPKRTWHRFQEDMLPSDYFHRNTFLSFQEDALGVQMRHVIGVDNLLWGSDYPHQESTFPRSREILDRILADCTDEEQAKIVGGNSVRIFNLN